MGGLIFAGADLHGSASRTKSTVCLKEHVRTQAAYGYMNQQLGYDNNALQDFNLSLPKVHENVAGLPTPTPTNDYFMVAGSGSMFRAIRNDAGYVKDPATKSTGNAGALSGDAAFGTGFEAGVNLNYNNNQTSSQQWEEGNAFSGLNTFEFSGTTPATDPEVQARYEDWNFQKVNNPSSVSSARYTGIRQNTALRQEIDKAGGSMVGLDRDRHLPHLPIGMVLPEDDPRNRVVITTVSGMREARKFDPGNDRVVDRVETR